MTESRIVNHLASKHAFIFEGQPTGAREKEREPLLQHIRGGPSATSLHTRTRLVLYGQMFCTPTSYHVTCNMHRIECRVHFDAYDFASYISGYICVSYLICYSYSTSLNKTCGEVEPLYILYKGWFGPSFISYFLTYLKLFMKCSTGWWVHTALLHENWNFLLTL